MPLPSSQLNPLSDGRDLRARDLAVMKAAQPNIFDVPREHESDPRTQLGFGSVRDAVGRVAFRPYHGAPGQVWPQISSADPEFERFRVTLAKEASAAFKPQIDDDGFASDNAITRDFSALLTGCGMKMSHANAPLTDRSHVMGERGFATAFASRRHETIFKTLHKLMFGKRVVGSSYNFSVISGTTMPTHFAGRGSQLQKQAMTRHLLLNAEQILDAIDKGDLVTLFSQYNMYFAAKLGERAQPEGVADLLGGDFTPKKREVNDPLYALTGGREGRRFVADKRLIPSLFGLEHTVGARVRTVYALCGQISFFMSCFLTSMRQHYFHEYAYTWHHSTPEAIYEDIKDFEQIVGLDVTTMDQFFPKFLLDLHADLFENYVDKRFAKLIRWINGVPYFAPQLGAGMTPFWAGDPRNADSFNIDVGLSSGRPDNPDLGKWYMTGVYFCLMDDMLGDLLEQGPNAEVSLDRVLKGKHPVFGLKDMGDDAALGFKPGYAKVAEELRRRLREAGKALKAGLSPYAILDLEQGIAFLGNVFYRDATGKVGIPKPNPVTFLVNQHCPERGINTPHRAYWGHGYLAALEHYSRAGSVVGDLLRLQDDIWRSTMPGRYTPAQAAAKFRAQKEMPIGSKLGHADIEVLLDSAKLFYKYDVSDISPEIASMFTATIEGDFIEKHIGRYMR